MGGRGAHWAVADRLRAAGSLKLLKELNICKISEAALVQPMDDKKQHSRSLSVPFNDEVQAAPVAFRSCSPQSLEHNPACGEC